MRRPWLAIAAWLVSTASPQASREPALNDLGVSFSNIAERAGLTARTVYGGQGTNKYLLETTGTGVAAFDYDGDGWLDIFLVNGSTLDGTDTGWSMFTGTITQATHFPFAKVKSQSATAAYARQSLPSTTTAEA